MVFFLAATILLYCATPLILGLWLLSDSPFQLHGDDGEVSLMEDVWYSDDNDTVVCHRETGLLKIFGFSSLLIAAGSLILLALAFYFFATRQNHPFRQHNAYLFLILMLLLAVLPLQFISYMVLAKYYGIDCGVHGMAKASILIRPLLSAAFGLAFTGCLLFSMVSPQIACVFLLLTLPMVILRYQDLLVPTALIVASIPLIVFPALSFQITFAVKLLIVTTCTLCFVSSSLDNDDSFVAKLFACVLPLFPYCALMDCKDQIPSLYVVLRLLRSLQPPPSSHHNRESGADAEEVSLELPLLGTEEWRAVDELWGDRRLFDGGESDGEWSEGWTSPPTGEALTAVDEDGMELFIRRGDGSRELVTVPDEATLGMLLATACRLHSVPDPTGEQQVAVQLFANDGSPIEGPCDTPVTDLPLRSGDVLSLGVRFRRVGYFNDIPLTDEAASESHRLGLRTVRDAHRYDLLHKVPRSELRFLEKALFYHVYLWAPHLHSDDRREAVLRCLASGEFLDCMDTLEVLLRKLVVMFSRLLQEGIHIQDLQEAVLPVPPLTAFDLLSTNTVAVSKMVSRLALLANGVEVVDDEDTEERPSWRNVWGRCLQATCIVLVAACVPLHIWKLSTSTSAGETSVRVFVLLLVLLVLADMVLVSFLLGHLLSPPQLRALMDRVVRRAANSPQWHATYCAHDHCRFWRGSGERGDSQGQGQGCG